MSNFLQEEFVKARAELLALAARRKELESKREELVDNIHEIEVMLRIAKRRAWDEREQYEGMKR